MERNFKEINQVFMDMDGTIYNGSELFPTTIPFLEFLKNRNIQYTFLTNNSSYGHDEYIQRLARFGIKCEKENFYLSTDYAVDYLKRNHPEINRLFILGMPCMKRIFADSGFLLDESSPEAVVVGFDRGLTYENLCKAAWFLRNKLPGFATHPDLFCPTDKPTWLVDCGAITACLELSTNTKIKVLGKPDPGLLIEAANRKNSTADHVLMIGDRLSTDIALGKNAGALTCHITTSGAEFVIPENIKPDYSVKNLGELQQIWEKEL